MTGQVVSDNGARHRVLDMAFPGDAWRVRKGHGAQDLAILSLRAASLLKLQRMAATGIRAKPLRAGWDQEGLLGFLLGCLANMRLRWV